MTFLIPWLYVLNVVDPPDWFRSFVIDDAAEASEAVAAADPNLAEHLTHYRSELDAARRGRLDDPRPRPGHAGRRGRCRASGNA